MYNTRKDMKNMQCQNLKSVGTRDNGLHSELSSTLWWKLNQLARQYLVCSHLHLTSPAMKLGVHNAEQQVSQLEP